MQNKLQCMFSKQWINLNYKMSLTIVKHLQGNRWEVEIDQSTKYDPNTLQVAHDYVALWTNVYPSELKGGRIISSKYTSPTFKERVQLGNIRDIKEFLLPFLNEHEYLQDAHFATRRKDTHEAYEPYAYTQGMYKYYNRETKTQMVAIRIKGETTFNHVTLEFYNKFVKPNLK